MKISVLHPGKSFDIKEIDLPLIKEEEVLLKVNSCAICGSDLKIAKFGNKRIAEERTIGHEISGTIELIGNKVTGFEVGDKVSVGADLPCHKCNYCKNGNVNLCETNYAIGYQFNGGFAEFIILNEHVLKNGPIKKFHNVSFEEACLGEPLACAINGVRKSINCFAHGHPENALIFGGGPMGLLLAEYLSFLKVKEISIAETNSKRLDFIKNKTNFKAFDPSELNNESYDLIFTACPVLQTHKLALKHISVGGVVNFFGGLPNDAEDLSFASNEIHYKEMVLTGSHGSTPSLHEEAIDLIDANHINLRYLITHFFTLDELNDAFRIASSGEGQKIIIKPNE
jgi:L-iditol 2-dehydrogenase